LATVSSDRSLRRFGQVFDSCAPAYDEVRRSYPPVLIDAAIERGGLEPGSRVLEVGCGTGKLTELLAGRGLVVDAVDPGENMIDVARKRVGETDRVRFHLGRFEELPLEDRVFDGAFSATAFHWIEPEIGWQKVARHLKPGGLFGLLAHVGIRNEGRDEAEAAFHAVLEKHAPEAAASVQAVRDLETILAGVEERRGNVSEVWDWLMADGRHGLAVDEAAELFEDVELATVELNVEQTADESQALFRTTSLYFQIDPERREAFEADDRRVIESFGGTVKFSMAAVLVTALRRGSPTST
jgi:ubiquinone/menaquinone biosynthesis C-methylase UbiE